MLLKDRVNRIRPKKNPNQSTNKLKQNNIHPYSDENKHTQIFKDQKKKCQK